MAHIFHPTLRKTWTEEFIHFINIFTFFLLSICLQYLLLLISPFGVIREALGPVWAEGSVIHSDLV